MRSITIDILDKNALKLLKDLELLKLIKIRPLPYSQKDEPIDWKKYKGAMEQEKMEDVQLQLNELRNQWE